MKKLFFIILIIGWPFIIRDSYKAYKKERGKKELFFLALSLVVYIANILLAVDYFFM